MQPLTRLAPADEDRRERSLALPDCRSERRSGRGRSRIDGERAFPAERHARERCGASIRMGRAMRLRARTPAPLARARSRRRCASAPARAAARGPRTRAPTTSYACAVCVFGTSPKTPGSHADAQLDRFELRLSANSGRLDACTQPPERKRDARVVVAIAAFDSGALDADPAAEPERLDDVDVRRKLSVLTRAVERHAIDVRRDLANLVVGRRSDAGSTDAVRKAVEHVHELPSAQRMVLMRLVYPPRA